MSNNTEEMRATMRLLIGAALTAVAVLGWAQASQAANPGTGAHLPSQAAADILRDVAGTDGAFLAAGLVRETYSPDNLASLMQFPTDEIAIVSLTGADIREAFERSVRLYPQPNSSFLQISGFTVEFTAGGDPTKRIVSISADTGAFSDSATYTVAMPLSLARGGQGYFKVWDKAKIDRTLSNVTLESALKGKRFVATSPRWVLRS
jgi:2',3'-cyclic-nucleotide 2'-phosphodiesterase (5'-nucleotidase family)